MTFLIRFTIGLNKHKHKVNISEAFYSPWIFDKDFIKTLLKTMGCYQRYNNNEMVVNRIVGRVYDALQDEDSVVGKLGKNNNEEDIDKKLPLGISYCHDTSLIQLNETVAKEILFKESISPSIINSKCLNPNL